MSSRRTSARVKTVTPGRAVTTLKNPGTKAARNANNVTLRKNGKTTAGKSAQVDAASASESEESLSEDDLDDEDVYEDSVGDGVNEEEVTESDEVDSDDIDEPSSRRGASKRKQLFKGKGNGSSTTATKKQRTSATGKAVTKPVKRTPASAKNVKTKPKTGDNYPAPAASDSEGDEEAEEMDYSSYSDGGAGESDDSIELEEGQEIKGYANVVRILPCSC